MLFELATELLTDFSPVYIYISLLFSAVYIGQMHLDYQLHLKNHMENRWHNNTGSYPLHEPLPFSAIFHIKKWIANKTKRIEIPDDDKDASSSPIINQIKIRGGFIWKIKLYSPNGKNISYSHYC